MLKHYVNILYSSIILLADYRLKIWFLAGIDEKEKHLYFLYEAHGWRFPASGDSAVYCVASKLSFLEVIMIPRPLTQEKINFTVL
jgi:hypothetical protein